MFILNRVGPVLPEANEKISLVLNVRLSGTKADSVPTVFEFDFP
jgi:hypothetical protein